MKKVASAQGTLVLTQRKLPSECKVHLRIDQGGNKDSGYFGVGICQASLLNLKPFFVHQRDTGNFISYMNYKGSGMLIVGGKEEKQQYGESYSAGDIITIDLNTTEEYLIFYKNGKKFSKIMLTDLTTRNFHLAVWMNYIGDQVSIITEKDVDD